VLPAPEDHVECNKGCILTAIDTRPTNIGAVRAKQHSPTCPLCVILLSRLTGRPSLCNGL